MKTLAMTTFFLRPALLASALLLSGGASAQTFSKTEVISYYDNTASWVLGQTASVACTESIPASSACDGDVVSATSFDSVTALPTATSAFGKLQSTMTYNNDGTLATVTDGNNRTTTLSDWKRGVPQLIQFADLRTKSAVVNDNGWIMSVTDENGYTTGYQYDVMGRLSYITYPPGGWSNTSRSFVPVSGAEYGIAAGHWRETVTTGQHVKITYYDGLWRPVLVREYDSGNSATQRFTKMAYDSEGRQTFQSYASISSSPTTGTWTAYDALGRVTGVSQSSDLGNIGTSTTYEAGFITVTTNANGGSAIASYLTYDQPTTDWPLIIDAEEGQTTTIARDAQGKPTSLTRSGGGTGVTRSYTYNGNQELCKSVEPETGATLYAYDGAGNLTGTLAGATDTSPTCNGWGYGAVGRFYDARNRLTGLSFPDGNGNQTWTYTPDGLPETVTTYNDGNAVTNSYSYNSRRLLVSETMVPDNLQLGWGVSYEYNGLGHVIREYRPGSVYMTYMVNALGQVTYITAGSDTESPVTLASDAIYYPNGALKQFSYGNGIVHTMSQNVRMLPARSTDCALSANCSGANRKLDLAYGYDRNGNVTGITDGTTGARQSRSMGYDALDRLRSVSSNMFGSATYTYDALDNLQQVSIGGSSARTHYYCYDTATNRLQFVRSGPACVGNADPAVIALGYDARGNVANKNGAVYSFDFGNRLRGTAGRTYRYDADGRRVREDVAGAQLKYSYYARDGRLVWQRDAVAGKRINFAYLGGSAVAEYMRPIGVSVATITYVHSDALGSPIAKTDAARTVIETSEYEPYGKLLNRANDDRPGYTGHVMDSASGLTYMQQRYYDPTIGRFLSVDPVTADGNTGGNFNRYWYANDNPYRFTDPDGRKVKIVGDREFKREVKSQIKELKKTPTGKQIVQALKKSEKTFTISENTGSSHANATNLTDASVTPSGTPGAGSSGTIAHDPTWTPAATTANGPAATPSSVVLGHELAHAVDYDKGTLDRSVNPATGVRRSEEKAMGVENQIRQEMGLPQRTVY